MSKYFQYFFLLLTFYSLFSPAVLADSTDQQVDTNQDNSILTNSLPSEISSEQVESTATKIVEIIIENKGDTSSVIPPEPVAQTNTEIPQPSIEESPKSTESVSQEEQNDNKWHFKFQPYATIPISTYGSSTVKGRTLDYSLSLGSLLEVLRVTASGRLEAWHNNLGFIIEAYYVSLNGGGIKESNPPIQANLSSFLTFDQGIYDFALSYHLGAPAMYSLPEKPSNKPFPLLWFEPIVGVRLNTITSSINSVLNFGRIDASFEKNVTAGRTWFEPLIGGKIGLQISDPVTLWVKGNVSGFGLAGDTDLSWNVVAGADWWVSKTISLQLGYLFYQLNYQNGSGNNAFGLEQNVNGPYLSATFNF